MRKTLPILFLAVLISGAFLIGFMCSWFWQQQAQNALAETLKNTQETARAERAARQSELMDLKAGVTKAQTALTVLQTKFDDTNSALQTARGTAEKLKASEKSLKAALAGQTALAAETGTRHKNALAVLDKEIAGLKKSVRESQAKAASDRARLADRARAVTRLEQELAAFADIKAKAASDRTRLADRERTVTRLEQALSDKNGELATKTKELAVKTEELTAKAEELTAKANEVEGLKRNLKNSDGEKDILYAEIERYSAQSKAMLETLGKELGGLDILLTPEFKSNFAGFLNDIGVD